MLRRRKWGLLLPVLGVVLSLGSAHCNQKDSEVALVRASATASEGDEAAGGKGQKRAPAHAQRPIRLPGNMARIPWLDGAALVVALKVEGKPVLVAAGTGWLRWFGANGERLGERVGRGYPQVLKTMDLDGDGTLEVVFARGMGRDAAKAKATLEVLHFSSFRSVSSVEIPLPPTSRQQVVGVAQASAADGGIWVASFVSKFEVKIERVKKSSNSWSVAEIRGEHRVVSDLAVLADGTPVISRMYGDRADAPGGVYALPPARAPQPLPSTRGARALLFLPARNALAMADGWHKHYGKRAQGLVTIVKRSGESWRESGGVEVLNNYGFTGLRIANVSRENHSEVLAVGNGPVVVVLPERPDLLYQLGDLDSSDAVGVDLVGDRRQEVVIVGPHAAIWSPL